MNDNNLDSFKILFNNYNIYPFLSKESADKQAEVYNFFNAKVYIVPPNLTNSELILSSQSAYLVVYENNDKYRVVDMEGSFTILEKDFNLLKAA